MRTIAVLAIALALTLPPTMGWCAYPSLLEAQTLFSCEMMNSLETRYPNILYDDFAQRLGEPSVPGEASAVETAVLQGITSIVVTVSTNAVDDGTPAWLPVCRSAVLDRITPNLWNFRTNAVNCLSVAVYAGSVKKVDYPDYLTRMRGGVVRGIITTNEVERARFLEEERLRKTKLAEARDLQWRVRRANEAVADYRRTLMEVCAIGVEGCRGIMSDKEFAAFTNRVVTASGASEQEKAILFRGLAGD